MSTQKSEEKNAIFICRCDILMFCLFSTFVSLSFSLRLQSQASSPSVSAVEWRSGCSAHPGFLEGIQGTQDTRQCLLSFCHKYIKGLGLATWTDTVGKKKTEFQGANIVLNRLWNISNFNICLVNFKITACKKIEKHSNILDTYYQADKNKDIFLMLVLWAWVFIVSGNLFLFWNNKMINSHHENQRSISSL